MTVKDLHQFREVHQRAAEAVDRLVSEIQGEFEFADTDVFMEFHDWSLLDHSSKLVEGEFAIRETARSFEIDLDGNRITYQFADEEEQLALDVDVEGWTPEALVLWLDRQVRQPDINQSELLRWLRDLVGHLITAAVSDFAAHRPATQLRLLAGTAQLLGYRRPDAVVRALLELPDGVR